MGDAGNGKGIAYVEQELSQLSLRVSTVQEHLSNLVSATEDNTEAIKLLAPSIRELASKIDTLTTTVRLKSETISYKGLTYFVLLVILATGGINATQLLPSILKFIANLGG